MVKEIGDIVVCGEWNEEMYYWNGKEFVCVTPTTE